MPGELILLATAVFNDFDLALFLGNVLSWKHDRIRILFLQPIVEFIDLASTDSESTNSPSTSPGIFPVGTNLINISMGYCYLPTIENHFTPLL